MPAHILLVDDDQCQRSDMARMVASFGYDVTTAIDGQDAVDKLKVYSPNAILADLIMPRMDGFALLKELVSCGEQIPTIILAAVGRGGARQPGVLRTLLEPAVQQSTLRKEAEVLRRQLSYQGVLGELVGSSQPMMETPTSPCVPIGGESGTGKELVMRAIHNLSSRREGPFVAVTCAALPETPDGKRAFRP